MKKIKIIVLQCGFVAGDLIDFKCKDFSNSKDDLGKMKF